MNQGRQIRWGFIGASTIADEHMVGAVRQAGGEVLAIASSSDERATLFAKAHSIAKAYGSTATLLADKEIDAVYISTTNDLHCEQVIAAANSGKHVLCEKPMALSLKEAQTMIASCRDAGVQLGINHHLRNAGSHRAMRDLVAQGAVGRVLFVRVFHAIYLRPKVQGWRIHGASVGGGPILDIAVHDIDAVRFILQAEPLEAIGMAQSATLASAGLEDGAMAVIRMSNDALVHIHAAFTVPYAGTGIEIHGDKGSIIARDVMTAQQSGTVILRNAEGEKTITPEATPLYAHSIWRFTSAIHGNGQAAATGVDGMRSLAGALAVAEACRTGCCVSVLTDG